MDKNATSESGLIIALVVVAAFLLVTCTVSGFFLARKILIRPVDMTGGTSLVYEINTQGLTEEQKKGLSERMIAVLRKRIDPRGRMPLVWRSVGDCRFEIQMPLAGAEARLRRSEYKDAEAALLNRNLSLARILRTLEEPAAERNEHFESFAQGDPARTEILDNLASVYDECKALENSRDELYGNLRSVEAEMASAGLDLDQITRSRIDWVRLDEQELGKSLREFADADDNATELLTGYVKTFAEWANAADQLLTKQVRYEDAKGAIDQLNLSKDRLDFCLEASRDRAEKITQLKADFPDSAVEIDKVVAAYDRYRPHRGRLDDPEDLQRMLRGAGILEFRVLPTQDHPEVDMDLMADYVTRLDEKGPRYASDASYVWCEIESIDEWRTPDAITAAFGGEYYVLASNQSDEVMLHRSGSNNWQLKRANATHDSMGRRAIGFQLDSKGSALFGKLTSNNVDRPLCILLDDIAISAPNVIERIPGGRGIISGSFTQTDVDDMANKLNAGCLPAPLIEKPVSIRTIGEVTEVDEPGKEAEGKMNPSGDKL